MKQTKDQVIESLRGQLKALKIRKKSLERDIRLLEKAHDSMLKESWKNTELRSAEGTFSKDIRDIVDDLRNAFDITNASGNAFKELGEMGIHSPKFSMSEIDAATSSAYSRWFARLYLALIKRDTKVREIMDRKGEARSVPRRVGDEDQSIYSSLNEDNE